MSSGSLRYAPLSLYVCDMMKFCNPSLSISKLPLASQKYMSMWRIQWCLKSVTSSIDRLYILFIYLSLSIIMFIIAYIWILVYSCILLGITYSADCFAYCVMAHLLWPTRSEQYFLLKGQSSADLEELDEFNEAPHIVNNSYTSMDSMGSLEICRYEDPLKTKLINAWTVLSTKWAYIFFNDKWNVGLRLKNTCIVFCYELLQVNRTSAHCAKN